MGEFSGKLVVITGAAGGIGRECVALLSGLGAYLLVIDRNEAALRQLVETCGGGERLKYAVSSLESPDACAAALSAVDRPVYGLVHLAGIYESDDVDTGSRPVWDRTLAVNLTSSFDIAAACMPRLDPGRTCRFVFISSVAYRRGSFDHIAYSASKGGVVGMVRAMSRRLAPKVLVNSVAPGIIGTAMTKDIIEQRAGALLSSIPLQRWGKAAEVAGVVKFLLSDDSSYVTGQVINCDGGIDNA